MLPKIESALADASTLLETLRTDRESVGRIWAIARAVSDTLKSGNKVLVCGNGGSMADAMHFAEEWTGRFRETRSPYPVIALADPTHITCVANDFGFEFVFARQVQALGRQGDLLLLLSTSGNSPSVVEAARAAIIQQVRIIGLLGKGGGALEKLCEIALVCPGETSDRIQELHMLCLHAIIEAVEGEL